MSPPVSMFTYIPGSLLLTEVRPVHREIRHENKDYFVCKAMPALFTDSPYMMDHDISYCLQAIGHERGTSRHNNSKGKK